MNLNCHVAVNNQLLPLLNVGRRSKACYANLAICQTTKCIGTTEDKPSTYLLVRTTRNQSGTKYEIKGNLKQVFKNFINEGKATIRLIQPPHDIVISKADPAKLKEFLWLLNLSLQKSTELKFLPPPSQFCERPPEKLIIQRRENYPASFPSSLNTVHLNSCHLKKIDPRILRLHQLQILDLEDNRITAVPVKINNLYLSSLTLAQNAIKVLPKEICEGNLSKCLRYLNVEKNLIECIPSAFVNLEKLHFFNISHNKLTTFPSNIGNMKNLKIVRASANMIKSLPESFKRLKLHTFDLTDNPLNEVHLLSPKAHLLSLIEFTAATIRNLGIPYSPAVIPSSLVDYLDNNSAECMCGKVTFSTSLMVVTKVDIRSFAHTTYFTEDKQVVPVKTYCCSKGCWQRITRTVASAS